MNRIGCKSLVFTLSTCATGTRFQRWVGNRWYTSVTLSAGYRGKCFITPILWQIFSFGAFR